jgi:hypothetical protein
VLNTGVSSVADRDLEDEFLDFEMNEMPELFKRLAEEKRETKLDTVIQQVTVVVEVEVIVVAAALG